MITEDFVSFETAKLLKEKGFDWECKRMFRAFKNFEPKVFDTQWITNDDLCDLYQNCEFATIPTLQTAMKWLREVHNIHIEVKYFFEPHIYKYTIIYTPVALDNISSHPLCFNTYEQACEAAIEHCLENLI